MTLKVSNAVSVSKTKFYERLATKPNDPKTASKAYLFILKTFSKGTKIPFIPCIARKQR